MSDQPTQLPAEDPNAPRPDQTLPGDLPPDDTDIDNDQSLTPEDREARKAERAAQRAARQEQRQDQRDENRGPGENLPPGQVANPGQGQ